jgi:glycosyltransferase involved in cell wall biosynthesis
METRSPSRGADATPLAWLAVNHFFCWQSMRIVVASTYVPFRKEGEFTIVQQLADALRERDYLVETVLLPFDPDEQSNGQQTLAIRSLDLSESCGNKIDLLITLGPPAHALPHPNKVVWLSRLLKTSDARYLREARRLYAGSKTIVTKLKELNGIDVRGILYPPLFHPERFHNADYGDYFVYISRLNPRRRQELAIQAMKYVKRPFKLILAGQADPESYGPELQRLIRLLDLEGRVQLSGWVSEQQKVELLANACAALYLPLQADSYGYATLEAFQANKPVITLTDSGAPTEIIEDSFNGLIVEPQAEALAAAMEKLWADKTRAALMGQNAHDSIRFHQISRERLLEALLA